MTSLAAGQSDAAVAGQTAPVVELESVSRHFAVRTGGLFSRNHAYVRAVDDVSLAIAAAETVGVVGESGCGKTTLARLILRDLPPTGGRIRFEGRALDEMSADQRQALTRLVGAVFQDPFSSLNPRHRVGTIVIEPAVILGNVPRGGRRKAVTELLELVGLPPQAAEYYPHEFSGGQRQRIAVARALSVNPRLLVLDEPISALDVSIRAQIINLFKDVQRSFNLAYMFIAHDLASVYHMADRVVVMYLGQVVETAETIELYSRPSHPYTRALLSASLPIDPRERDAALVLGGEVPSPLNPPPGCRFHTRCPLAVDRCRAETPAPIEVAPGHRAACFFADDLNKLGPPVKPPMVGGPT